MSYQLNLLSVEHDQAVLEMVAHFQRQLKEAASVEEIQLINEAITGWMATIGPPEPSTRHDCKRSRTRSNQGRDNG